MLGRGRGGQERCNFLVILCRVEQAAVVRLGRSRVRRAVEGRVVAVVLGADQRRRAFLDRTALAEPAAGLTRRTRGGEPRQCERRHSARRRDGACSVVPRRRTWVM